VTLSAPAALCAHMGDRTQICSSRLGSTAVKAGWALPIPARAASLLLLISLSAAAQESTPAPAAEDSGYLEVSHDHTPWPTPELLVKDLRSKDDKVRLQALRLLGFAEQETHTTIWAQTSPTKVIGEAVVTPDQIELEYAALGEDATQQVILSVHASQKQLTFAAVAAPRADGWERIAAFDCWCKYETDLGRDALAESVQVRPAPEPGPRTPEHFELILRASGGGTGIYTQNEGHFRIRHGELREVMSFVSRRRSCPLPEPCKVERRWFYTTGFGNVMGGVLVEGRGSYASINQPLVDSSLRDLEVRILREVTCSTYRWDQQSFRYEPFSAPNPCEPIKPHN
jgi:hypothetical protein